MTAKQGKIREGRNSRAAGYMLVAVATYSLTPLLVKITGAGDFPFLFNSLFQTLIALGTLGYLSWRYRNRFPITGILRAAITSWHQYRMIVLLAVLSRLHIAFFAWSARFVDVAVTAIIFELWVILFIYLRKRHDRVGRRRYKTLTAGEYNLAIAAFLGVAVVIWAQGAHSSQSIFSSVDVAIGVTIALMAASVTAAVQYIYRWGELIYKRSTSSDEDYELVCILITSAIALLGGGAISGLIGLTLSETMPVESVVLMLPFIVPQILALVCLRKAILVASSLGVGILAYLIPVLSLVWLALFTSIDVPQPDLLVIGASVVVGVNVLINFKAEDRQGFSWLVISLWLFGLFVYLRDGWLSGLLGSDWYWTGGEYFGLLALSATVFTLILAFRITRLVNRTTWEDQKTFDLYRKLEGLVHGNKLKAGVLEQMKYIDMAGGGNVGKCKTDLNDNGKNGPAEEWETLRSSYRTLIGEMFEARDNGQVTSDQVSDIAADVDALVHSKQKGRTIAEPVVLGIFAIITLMLALGTRPELAGWPAVLLDLFAVLFSAAIVFLTVNVSDLSRERSDAVMRESSNDDNSLVKFRGRVDTTSEINLQRGVSIAIGFVIVVVYAVLLYGKWILMW